MRRWTLCAVIAVGSAWDAWQVIGPAGIAIALVWGLVAGSAVDWIATRVSWRVAVRGALAIGVIAVAAFALVYPLVDGHTPAQGTDRDDDADVAVLAALHGRDPYAERTYLGNPVTHLPGSLVVAAPFVALGGSALENVVVVPLAVWLVARRTRSAAALAVLVGGAAATVGVWHEFLTGGNTLAEWSLLSAAAVLLVSGTRRWWAPLLFGFALNIRTNAWCAAGAAVGGEQRRRGWTAAIAVAAVVAAVQAVLLAPFAGHGARRLAHITSGSEKFAYLDRMFSHASVVVPAVAAIAAAVVACEVARRSASPVGVLLGLSASQVVQFGLLIVASAAAGSEPWALNWSYYLVLCVPPALAALALREAA